MIKIAHLVLAADSFHVFWPRMMEWWYKQRATGKYKDKTGQNLCIRELKFFDFQYPKEKEEEILKDVARFLGEYYYKGRYGERKKGLWDGLQILKTKLSKWIIKLFFGRFLPFKLVDMTKVWHKVKPFDIMKEKWFCHMFPIGIIEDGFIKKGIFKDFEII